MKQKHHNNSQIVVSGLLDYLKQEGQEELLPAVTYDLQETVSKSRQADTILVESPIPMDSQQVKSLQSILKKKFQIELPIENKVNKKLVAGFTVTVGDWFLDASILTQLQKLKQILLS